MIKFFRREFSASSLSNSAPADYQSNQAQIEQRENKRAGLRFASLYSTLYALAFGLSLDSSGVVSGGVPCIFCELVTVCLAGVWHSQIFFLRRLPQ